MFVVTRRPPSRPWATARTGWGRRARGPPSATQGIAGRRSRWTEGGHNYLFIFYDYFYIIIIIFYSIDFPEKNSTTFTLRTVL